MAARFVGNLENNILSATLPFATITMFGRSRLKAADNYPRVIGTVFFLFMA
jgi:hypothetical protein